MALLDMRHSRISAYERALYVVGVSGGIVALLCPFLFPYFGDIVGVATLTLCNAWAAKKIVRIPARRAGARSPLFKWWLLGHASLAYALLSGWEWLQSADVVWGVYDRYDYAAFTAGYIMTVALLASIYRAVRRQPHTGTLLW